MKKIQKGFTLIELMIVVAIIGILAAIAIPAYQDYLIRTQASEGLSMASAAKASVSEFRANRGTWPATNTAAGIEAVSTNIDGKYVSEILVENGAITVTYGNEANVANLATQTVTLIPWTSVGGDVIWQCGYAAQPAGAAGGTNGGPSTAGTTVAPKYLPSNCRA